MNKSNVNIASEPQYGIWALLFFTFAPAAFVLLAKGVASQTLSSFGGIIATAVYQFTEVVIFIVFMGIIARRDGVGTWMNTIIYRRQQAWPWFFLLLALATAWSIYFRDYFSWGALNSFSASLRDTMSFWPPEFLSRPERGFPIEEAAGSAVVIGGYSLALASYGAASAFQTLYFRGVILPRMDRFGWIAPFANTALFAAYHLSSPWFWPQFFIFTLIWGVIAIATRSVWAAVASHVIFNTYWFSGQILVEIAGH